MKEIERARSDWSKLATKDGVSNKVLVDAESALSGIDSNIAMLESYKRFPEKLSKYLSWKERYVLDILCNVDSLQNMMGGWIENNGDRFKAWIEMTTLVKSILKTWQVIPDLFAQYDAECGVCRNERHDAKFSLFKVISAIIPKIPVIKFPKWPDVMLDLSKIRL